MGFLEAWHVASESSQILTWEAYSPIVGMVVTTSPNFNWYSTVVFPAASSPEGKWGKFLIKSSEID